MNLEIQLVQWSANADKAGKASSTGYRLCDMRSFSEEEIVEALAAHFDLNEADTADRVHWSVLNEVKFM